MQPNAELETVTPQNPTAIVFPLTLDYGFPVKKNLGVPIGWRVGGFEKTSLNLGFLSDKMLGTAVILFGNFISLRSYPVLCFAKACLSLFFFCFFSIFLCAFLSGDDTWGLSKKTEGTESGEK